MEFLDTIMKTQSKDLIKMDSMELSLLQINLQKMKGQIDLTVKALAGIQSLKEKANVH